MKVAMVVMLASLVSVGFIYAINQQISKIGFGLQPKM
jgi:hypothetical protein